MIAMFSLDSIGQNASKKGLNYIRQSLMFQLLFNLVKKSWEKLIHIHLLFHINFAARVIPKTVDKPRRIQMGLHTFP